MVRSDDTLSHIIELLVGVGKPKFGYEPALRLFQFKYWLIDDTERRQSCFAAASLIFTSLVLKRISDRTQKKFPGMRGSDLMLLSISHSNVRPLLDKAFKKKLSWSDLTQVPWDVYTDEGTTKERGYSAAKRTDQIQVEIKYNKEYRL